jgi:ribosomal protein L37AE/L43A
VTNAERLDYLSNEAYLRGDERRSWLLYYKAQIAAGEVCPECDTTEHIQGARDFFVCLQCEHSWCGEEVAP